MKKRGTVMRWDATRGFGFIRSSKTDQDIFFHIKNFQGQSIPHEGLAVSFEEIHVGGKGPRAMAVRPLGADQTAHRPPTSNPQVDRTTKPPNSRHLQASSREASTGQSSPIWAMLLMLSWVALVLWGVWTQRLPLLTLAVLPTWNLVTFWIYWNDKYAAQKRRWRTQEDTLHLFGLLGGWPGAWFAHQILRHKSRKAAFRATYWTTVLANCAALVGWLFWLQPTLLTIQ